VKAKSQPALALSLSNGGFSVCAAFVPQKRRSFMDQIKDKNIDAGSWVKGLAAITLFVDDLPAARQFY
jgi:hypothetical protein